MAEQYRFFGSAEGDERQYNQTEFAEVFSRLLRNGYFPEVGGELRVVQNVPATMNVLVPSGEAWINGYWYKNDSPKMLTISPAHATLNRIDRIVLRLDVVSDRVIVAEVKQGSYASNPVPPSLTRTAQTYEIALAQIYVVAGTTSITDANITDERNNFELCGQAIPYYTGEKLSKNLDADNKKIINLANPTAAQDVVTKKYVDDGLNTKVNTTDVSTTAAPNKLLKLNAQSKLPASITGDANSVGGKTLTDMESMYAHAQKVYGSVTYNEPFNAYETKTKYINLPSNKYKNGVMRSTGGVISFFGTDSSRNITFGVTKMKDFGIWTGYVTRRHGDADWWGNRDYVGIDQFFIENDKIKIVLTNSTYDSQTFSMEIYWEVW